jgi:hypothetical protein
MVIKRATMLFFIPRKCRPGWLFAGFLTFVMGGTGMSGSADAHEAKLTASGWKDQMVFDLGQLQPVRTARLAQEASLQDFPTVPERQTLDDPQSVASAKYGPDTETPGPLLESDGRTWPYKEKFAGHGWTKALTRMELVFQGLHTADMAETLECMSRPRCSEKNPILGKRPGTLKVVGFTAATGVAHYYLIRRIACNSTKLAKIASMISIAGKAVVVSLNFNELR